MTRHEQRHETLPAVHTASVDWDARWRRYDAADPVPHIMDVLARVALEEVAERRARQGAAAKQAQEREAGG